LSGGRRASESAIEMSGRREQIKMSAPEVQNFLAQERTVICATHGPRGWPHLMPLWYVLRPCSAGGQELWAWTYAASQKVRNIERDSRVTLQVQAGESYEQLRGVMLECDALLHRDFDTVHELGLQIFARYSAPAGSPPTPVSELDPQVAAMVQTQALKRVALQFRERRRTSFDHRKLDGLY
jgi:general stress protein 26